MKRLTTLIALFALLTTCTLELPALAKPVNFNKTKLLAGDKLDIRHDKKTGKITVTMPPVSYAIVKL